MHAKASSHPVGALMRLARQQAGVFTTSQAASEGVSPDQLRALVRKGVVARRRRSLYVVTGSPLTHERIVMEAVLGGPEVTIASHQTAAHLLGILAEPAQVHVTVPRGRRLALDGVVAHRSVVPAHHAARVGRIPTTSLARTVVDLASVADLETLARVVDPLIVSGRLDSTRVLRTLDDIVDGPGRHGTVLLREVLDVWATSIRPDSPAEVRLLRRLTERGHHGFVAQHPVVVEGVERRLDVAWPVDRVALEYSGKDFHGPRVWSADEERFAALARLGWRVREVDAPDLLPGAEDLWAWLALQLRTAA